MNKQQKEVQQAFLDSEKEVLNKLKKNYQDALDEINSKIEILMARQDADMQHVIYQVEYQKALKKQVQGILDTLQANEFETVSEYLAKSYEDGFIGTMYDLQGQGVPLVMPIDQEQVIAAIQHETKLSEDLYTSLGKDIKDLQKKISSEISRGISGGQMYSEISRNIANYAGISRNKAMRIARTEGHRIQCKATSDAQFRAKDKGADIVKQWDAALDRKTRPTHRQLDGQIRELEEEFEVNGHKAMMPGGFDIAKEDINCRCALLQRARWALDHEYTKWSEDAPIVIDDDGTTQYVQIEAKNYEQFKERYQERVRGGTQKMNDEDDYLQSKMAYDKEVERVHKLEKDNDKLMDDYMDAMDTPDADRLEKLFNKSYEELESAREVLKDLKATLSGKEAKAVRHIEKNLADMTGIPLSKIKMDGMPYDSANMVFNSYNKVLSKYPELKGNLIGFDYTKDFTKGSYASCNLLTGNVEAHGVFGNFDNLVNLYAEDVAKRYHPIGTDHRSIIVHELGHALDGYMTKQGLVDAEISKFGITRTTSRTTKDMTLKFLGFDKQEISMELRGQGLKTPQIFGILEQREKEFITTHVSEYASESEREFFAECFAEYIMSDNPREASRIFGEIIDKALGR